MLVAFLRKYQLAATAVLVALVAALLYGQTVSLPLLFDDLLHIRLVKGLDFGSVWLPSTGFAFYRPVVFLPFLIIKRLFGYYPAPLLHGLNVAQHALNVALLAALVWRLWRRWPRALAAGLLLATYPFAYQAVAFYGNNVYLTGAGLILLALHTYLTAVQQDESRLAGKWLAATAVLFGVGLLLHETIVLLGPLAALLHWTNQEHTDWDLWRQHWRRPRALLQQAPYLLFIGLGGLYILIYPFIPTGNGPGLDAGGNALWPKMLYLGQTAVYPLAWLAHRLPGLSANAIIGGGLVLTLALTAWAAQRRQNRLPLLLGWGWWGLASLLIGVNLPTYYIEHGARLTYLGGVGIIFVWALLLDQLLTLKRGRWLLWGLGLGTIVLSSGSFVQDRLAAFADISSPVALVETVMAERPSDEGVLLINLPSWTSPVRNTYAAGVEYVTLMGGHLFAEELIVENLNRSHPVRAVAAPGLLTDPGYPYGTHAQADLPIAADWAPAGSHVFISRATPQGIVTEYAGQLRPSTYTDDAPVATFGPYALQAGTAVHCGDIVETAFIWQKDGETVPPTTSTFVQLLDEQGQLIDQDDGPLLGIRPDFLQLKPGWEIVGYRQMAAGANPSHLLLGVYDFVSGERYPAQDSQQNPLPDNALSLPFTPCPDEE